MSENSFQFEKSLQQLSDLVNSLDNDALSVEKSLHLYEQGMQLVSQCQNYLNQSKTRIEQIHKGKDKIIASNIVVEEIDGDVSVDQG